MDENQVPFVYDGDTTYENGKGQRLYGIDSMEIKIGQDGMTGSGAPEARDRLGQILADNPDYSVEVKDVDKYGREVVVLRDKDGKDINAQLVREGHAVPLDFGGGFSPYHREYDEYLKSSRNTTVGRMVNEGFGARGRSITQELSTAIDRGMAQTGMMFGAGIEALGGAIGSEELKEFGARNARRNYADVLEHLPTVGSYKDVDSFADAAYYVAGLVGEELPSIGVDLLAAAGGAATGGLAYAGVQSLKQGVKRGVMQRIVGDTVKKAANRGANTAMLTSMYGQMVGEVNSELKQNGIESPETALAFGAIGASLDFIGLKALMGTAGRMLRDGRHVTGNELLVRGMANTALEGATETAQEIMNKAAVLYHNTGYDLFSEANQEDFINAAIGGMLIGSMPGAIGYGGTMVRDAVRGYAEQNDAKRKEAIEKQNQQLLEIEENRSDLVQGKQDDNVVEFPGEQANREPVAVTMQYTRADGTTGRAQRMVSPQRVAAFQEEMTQRAVANGLPEPTFIMQTPDEVVQQRVEAGEQQTVNGDHVNETTEELVADVRATRDGMKRATLMDVSKFQQVADALKAEEKEGLQATITEDGRVILHEENETENVHEITKDSRPETYDVAELTDIPDYQESQAEKDEPPTGEALAAGAIPFEGDDFGMYSATAGETEQQAAEQTAEPAPIQGPHMDEAAAVKAAADKVAKERGEQAAEEGQIITDTMVEGIGKRDAIERLAGLMEVDPLELHEAAERMRKNPNTKDATAQALKALLDNSKVSKEDREAERQLRDKEEQRDVFDKVPEDAGEFEQAMDNRRRQDMEVGSDDAVPDGVRKEKDEKPDAKKTQERVEKAKGQRPDNLTATATSDDMAAEVKAFKDGLEMDVNDGYDDRAIFRRAVSAGIEAAHQNLWKAKVREVLGKSSTQKEKFEALFGEKMAATLSATKQAKIMRQLKDTLTDSSVWADKTVALTEKAHVTIRRFDEETGEYGGEHIVYLPEVMKEINSTDWRFNTTSSQRNYAARMEDAASEFFAYLLEQGYYIFPPPNHKDNTVHIAYNNDGGKPMTMARINSRARRKAYGKEEVGSQADWLDERLQEDLANIRDDTRRAIDRYRRALERVGALVLSNEKVEDSEVAFAHAQVDVAHRRITDLWAHRERVIAEHQERRQAAVEEQLAAEEQQDAKNRRNRTDKEEDGAVAADAAKTVPSAVNAKPKATEKKAKDTPDTVTQRAEKLADKLAEKVGLKWPVVVEFSDKLGGPARIEFSNNVATIKLGKKFAEMAVDVRDYIIAHEIGHAAIASIIKSVDDKTLAALHKEFAKARDKAPAGHPYKRQKGVGFDEWLADQFAAYVVEPKKFQKAKQAPLRSMFNAIRDVLQKVMKAMGLGRTEGNPVAQAFMASAFRGMGNPSTSLNPQDVATMAAMEPLRTEPLTESRYETEMRALGKKPKAGERANYPRDYTVGQALSATSEGVRAALAGVRNGVRNPNSMVPPLKRFLDFTRKAAPILHTANSELHGMGAMGKRIARAFRTAFEESSAQNAMLRAQAMKVLDSLKVESGETTILGKPKMEYREDMQAFMRGEGPMPSELKTLMRVLHKRFKTDLETLGYSRDYFPRIWDREQIEQREDELIQLLIDQAAAAGIERYGVPEARGAINQILHEDSAYGALPTERASVYGPSPAAEKSRGLHWLDDSTLRASGFIVRDVESVLFQYINRMTNRAAYNRQFGGYGKFTQNETADDTGGDTRAAMNRRLGRYLKNLPLFNERTNRLYTPAEKHALIEGMNWGSAEYTLRIAPLIQQAIRRNFLKLDDRNGASPLNASDLYFYDRNKKLRLWTGRLEPENQKRVATIVDAYEGRLGADKLSPQARKTMSTLVAYQNWLTLLFSAFSQAVEVSGIIFRNRDMEGAMESLREIVKLYTTLEGKERRQLMSDLGFADRQLTQQALLEAMGINYQSSTAQKMNEVLFKVNGMNYLTNASRVAGAAVAERFIQRHAAKAASGDERSLRYLTELGLTVEQAQQVGTDGFRHADYYSRNGDFESQESVDAHAIQSAMHKFVDSAIIRPNASHRPVWGSDPRWMLVWHLKSFMYAYGSVILKGLGGEVVSRYRENGSVPDAMVPLMVYMVPMIALSALALELRELVQYNVWGEEAPTEKYGGAKYAMELIKRGGMLGPTELGYSFLEDNARGHSGVVGLLGPSVGHLEQLLSFSESNYAADSISRSLPFVNQNRAMKDWMRELFRE